MSFHHSAYGLDICAGFPLWPWGVSEQREAPHSGSVLVEQCGPEQAFPVARFAPGLSDAVLHWPGVASFAVSHGERVRIRPAPGATAQELALITAGPVLALLLEQRGHVVLHGSCVEIDGKAVAFLGRSGLGKSTIAASLRERGHRLISDGMTVVDVSRSQAFALPGPPHLKLWPDAVDSLAPGPDTLPVARQENKRWFPANEGHAVVPVPLRQVFLLATGGEVQAHALGPSDALMGLVKNYFLADFADEAARAFILRRCAHLAPMLNVSTLQRGEGLHDVPSVIEQLTDSLCAAVAP